MADISRKPATRRSNNRALLYGLALGLLLVGFAAWRSTPLMTGPLSAVHADLEARCETCHTPFRGVQDRSCRSCHPDIGDKSPSTVHRKVRGNCATCHHEHRSRSYPLRLADTAAFDHDLTGFSLKKHHRAVACSSCHKTGQPYYHVARQCQECHPDWSRVNFDHGRVTGVPLIQHADQKCSDCHPRQSYGAPATCTPCHAADMTYHPGQKL
jgi:hypothetical protein